MTLKSKTPQGRDETHAIPLPPKDWVREAICKIEKNTNDGC